FSSTLFDLAAPGVCSSALLGLVAPGIFSSARWPLVAAPGDFSDGGCAWDGPPLSRPVVAPPPDGAVCCIVAPPPDSLLVPCALARPAPASSAIAATEIIRRLFIRKSPQCWHCPCVNRRRCEMFRRDSCSPAVLFVGPRGTNSCKEKGRRFR